MDIIIYLTWLSVGLILLILSATKGSNLLGLFSGILLLILTLNTLIDPVALKTGEQIDTFTNETQINVSGTTVVETNTTSTTLYTYEDKTSYVFDVRDTPLDVFMILFSLFLILRNALYMIYDTRGIPVFYR